MDYVHPDIWVNGRRIQIRDIVYNNVSARSDFERDLFTFIEEWFGGKTEFQQETSGSTGPPKLMTIARKAMVASARATQLALGFSQDQNALVCLSPRYIAGKMMVVRSFEANMRIYATDPTSNPLAQIPVDTTIHFAALVPYQIKSILDSSHNYLLEKINTAIIGGAALDLQSHAELQRYQTSFYATYGMTETVSHIALQKINGDNRQSYFKTLNGVRIRKDERDCLVITTPFLDEEIVTNDIVEIIADNQFVWVGRIDNIINSGGVKVSPEKIEERIGQIFTRSEISSRFFVHHVADIKLGQKIVLVMECPIPPHSVVASVLDELHSFSPYEKPRELWQVPQLVLTQTGKINRQLSFRHSSFLRAV